MNARTLQACESQILMAKVRVPTSLALNLPKLLLDRQKMTQVFTNIVVNAIEAMPNGGTLTVVSRRKGDEAVEVVFAETGCRIPPDVLGRIFDPFFTTKGGKGNGLGLSVCYGIVQAHGGTIRVESHEASGTMLTVCLAVPQVSRSRRTDMSPPSRILVVDDEVLVCKSMAAALVDQEREVDTALSGEEALAKDMSSPYDVIIVDLMMPGVSGMDLLKAMKGEAA